jgi:DMSO reductase anchor subunit
MKDDGSLHTIPPSIGKLDVADALDRLETTRQEILDGKVGWMGIVCVPPIERLLHLGTPVAWNRWSSHHSALSASIAGSISMMLNDFITAHATPDVYDEDVSP